MMDLRFRIFIGIVPALFVWKATAQTDATSIVRKADEHARGTSSQAEMSMTVVRPTWQREMSMKTWSEGTQNALVLITAPAKEKGHRVPEVRQGGVELDPQRGTHHQDAAQHDEPELDGHRLHQR